MIPDNKGTCPFFERGCVDKDCKICDKFKTSSAEKKLAMDTSLEDMIGPPIRFKGFKALFKSYTQTDEDKKKFINSWILFGVTAIVLFVIVPLVLMTSYVACITK